MADPLFGEYGMTVIGAQTLVLRAEDPIGCKHLNIFDRMICGVLFQCPRV